MREIDHLQERVQQQVASHPFFDTNTLEGALSKVTEESAEIQDAIDTFDVTQDAECHTALEAGHLLFNALQVCTLLGFSASDVLELAMMQIDNKYPSSLQTDGRKPPDALQYSKELYKAKGGDHVVFQSLGEV